MISVIIINYNGLNLLRDCLESLKLYAVPGSEIIVFDNGSTDGSTHFIEENFPYVRLVKSKVNVGFVRGCNQAAKLARGDFLLLLNSDTIVRSSINPMVSLLNSEPDVCVVGCRLLYKNGSQQESIGQRILPFRLVFTWTPIGTIINKFRQTVDCSSPVYNLKKVECDWVSGACLLTHKNKWEQLNGFDQDYFMYMEDVDYCLRVKRSGGKVVYTAQTVVTHLEGSGRPWIGRRALLNTSHSYLIYSRKFFRPLGRLFVKTFLPPVWLTRAIFHYFVYLIGKDPYGVEKAGAYLHGSLIIFSGKKLFQHKDYFHT